MSFSENLDVYLVKIASFMSFFLVWEGSRKLNPNLTNVSSTMVVTLGFMKSSPSLL